jgi:streptogramin lyase
MVQLTILLGALPLALTALAGTVDRRQTAATQVVNLRSVENLAVRPNGKILATNMNAATLYAVDPVAKTSSTALTVTGARGLSGIGEYSPDKYAIIGGNSIYSVDFTGTAPKATLVKAVAGAGTLNGLAVLNNETVLVADAGKGAVYSFNMATGDSVVTIQDQTMVGPGFGIDGIRVFKGELFYTNIVKNSFHRVKIDAAGKATGTIQTLWTNLMGDDLCVGPNDKLYVSTNGRNSVVEVDPAVGKANPVATVQGSTSCGFGRTDSDKNVMYVGGSAGIFAVTVTL